VVDINPALKDKRVDGSQLMIENDLLSALKKAQPEIAVVCTVSKIDAMAPTLTTLAEHGVSAVSSCEEMFYPWKQYPALCQQLDEMAKQHNIAILGTGVNPGLLMDTLPLLLTTVHSKIDSVLIERVQNAENRRIPFQDKIGRGLSQKEFDAKVNNQSLGHVGLMESYEFFIHYLDWKHLKTSSTINAVYDGDHISGIEQKIIAKDDNDQVKVTYLFRASMNESNPGDRIVIKGTPNVDMTISPPVHGDEATISILVNCIDSVLKSNPGLKTMADIPLPHYKF
jgi:4-hydroxy-tetrahydrodipicolinate reductase